MSEKVFATFEESVEFVRSLEEETTSKFVIVKHRKPKVGVHKVFWEERRVSGLRGSVIDFDGTPFAMKRTVIMDCYHGQDHHVAVKKKLKDRMEKSDFQQNADHSHNKVRFRIQESVKLNCPASVVIREICYFPEFKIEIDTRKRRLGAASRLRKALSDGSTVVTETKFLVKVPDVTEHTYHVTGEAAGFGMAIDKRVTDFIRQQVHDGIITSSEVRRHTEFFVKNSIFLGKPLPSPLNRKFYPSNRDYVNIIHSTRKSRMGSHVDQEQLLMDMDDWVAGHPEDKYFFRPYLEDSGDCVTSPTSDAEDIMMFSGGRCGLLLVHQTAWQRQLLETYGTFCLLDATYKTTKYALPLFFLCVKTNVHYVVVAEFVTQFEDAESIAEALGIIQSWNVNWKPKAFMTDF